MDDDNYVNPRGLLRLLSTFSPSQDVYLGRPSLDHPIEAAERVQGGGTVSAGPGARLSARGPRWGRAAGRRIWPMRGGAGPSGGAVGGAGPLGSPSLASGGPPALCLESS